MRPPSRYVTWYVGKMPTCSSENSQLVEQNVLKAVGRTQIEGSCKVYAGKTDWKTNWKLYPCRLSSKKWGALEAPWQMTPIRAAFTCCKACDSVGEDEFALLVSIPASSFFDQKTVHDKNSNGDIGGFPWFPNWDWKISKQSLSISEHCKKTTYHTKRPSLIFLNLSRASYMFGCIDIKWLTGTFMRAGGRVSNPSSAREKSQLVRKECLESSRQDTDRQKL